MLSLLHKMLDDKQKALQELQSEHEADVTCLLQVCKHTCYRPVRRPSLSPLALSPLFESESVEINKSWSKSAKNDPSPSALSSSPCPSPNPNASALNLGFL